MAYVVEIEQGCWLAPWDGDPGRTIVIGNASRWGTAESAEQALNRVRMRNPHRKFAAARVANEIEYQMDQNQSLPARVLAMCKRRNWCLHWTARGAYLHLESSELIESVRGKGTSTPTEEAGDVLLVLMSITENEGISWDDVIAAAEQKLAKLETLPPYQGEERMDNKSQSAAKPQE